MEDIFHAIRGLLSEMMLIMLLDMTIRGSPAIGVAGAYGVVFAVLEKNPATKAELLDVVTKAKEYLDTSRPTGCESDVGNCAYEELRGGPGGGS